MSEPNTYTASDIERYHRGEMTAAEMHRLEKAALDDPILADQLEGYRYTSTPAADLLVLQQKLQQRIEKDERNNAVIFRMQWLKAAALILLVGGAGWIVFQTFTGKQDNAANNQSRPEVIRNSPETGKDSVARIQLPASINDSLQTLDNVVVSKTPSQKKNKPLSGSIQKTKDTKSERSEKEQGFAVATTLLRADGNSADSLAGASAMAKKAPAPSQQSDTTKNLNIVLQPVPVQMEEVVIAKRKQVPHANRISILDTVKPVNGWDDFDDYVADNIQSPEEVNRQPTNNREVELSFSVDKGGNPKNITVTKSLCQKCDEEAIRLLKKGPKWKGKKGKVKIKFPAM